VATCLSGTVSTGSYVSLRAVSREPGDRQTPVRIGPRIVPGLDRLWTTSRSLVKPDHRLSRWIHPVAGNGEDRLDQLGVICIPDLDDVSIRGTVHQLEPVRTGL
jgi:hypothetical protein